MNSQRLEFFEFLQFCFQDLEDQPLTAIVSYIIFCLEISHKMSNHIYSTKRLSKILMLCFYIWFSYLVDAKTLSEHPQRETICYNQEEIF